MKFTVSQILELKLFDNNLNNIKTYYRFFYSFFKEEHRPASTNVLIHLQAIMTIGIKICPTNFGNATLLKILNILNATNSCAIVINYWYNHTGSLKRNPRGQRKMLLTTRVSKRICLFRKLIN